MAKTALYEVRDADIWTSLGRVNVGDVVELDATEARYFNDKGLLAPHIPADEVTEESIEDVPQAPPAPEREWESGRGRRR